jgi:hypothetical protein
VRGAASAKEREALPNFLVMARAKNFQGDFPFWSTIGFTAVRKFHQHDARRFSPTLCVLTLPEHGRSNVVIRPWFVDFG